MADHQDDNIHLIHEFTHSMIISYYVIVRQVKPLGRDTFLVGL
jgi:hypothetical protein